MRISENELNFQRLLNRTRLLCRNDFKANTARTRQGVIRLEVLFFQLQGDRFIDSDVIMQYGRDLQQLKIIIEAETKEDTREKLAVVESLPHQDVGWTEFSLNQRPTHDSNAMLKAETVAVYRADLRRQLIGESANDIVDDHEEEQHILANQLLKLTSEMKRNFEMAGTIVREDNTALSDMQSVTESNKSNLYRESKRLEHHARKSCVDCMMLLIVVMVIWSFIGMVLIMKIFPKRY